MLVNMGTNCPDLKILKAEQGLKRSAAGFMFVSDVTGQPTDLVFAEMQKDLDNFTCVPVTISWTATKSPSTI